jgi:dUTP pyrophosphatase
MTPVKISRLHPDVKLPQKMSAHASGYDVYGFIQTPQKIKPGERVLIETGLKLEMPPGMECQIRPRSGLAWKKGLTVINAPGTIDADYRGEIKVALINLGQTEIELVPQERIAQLVFCPVYSVSFQEASLSETIRGQGGFGSTQNN